MFGRISQPETAVESCARAVRDVILRGDLAPGERLPPERRLAEQLGVTRVTLRSALGRLAAAGLVRVRQGSGYVVQDYRRRGGPDLLPGLAGLASESGRLAEIVGDLLLVRRQLARAVLEKIAAGDGAGTGGVREAVDEFTRVAKPGADPAEVAAADMEVLGALLAATDSPVLMLCLNPVIAVVQEMPELRETIYAAPETNARGYRLLVDWMNERRPELIDTIIGELERRDRQTIETIAARRRQHDA